MIKRRGLIGLIVLSIITSGIYWFYWVHKLAKDLNTMCEGDGRKTAGFLKYFFFGLITFGIYDLAWVYMVGDRLHDGAPKYGLAFKEGGGTVLLWLIVGTLIVVGPFIAAHIVIKNTNALAKEYNNGITAQKNSSTPLSGEEESARAS